MKQYNQWINRQIAQTGESVSLPYIIFGEVPRVSHCQAPSSVLRDSAVVGRRLRRSSSTLVAAEHLIEVCKGCGGVHSLGGTPIAGWYMVKSCKIHL